ncbi:Protein of unknown function [Butyrivibrio sp. ob235]|uniref:glycosyltransferase domain-containing protein n=1 Tax=Butyrivibrio sp. ob235 TaxID=1761780 RepID=UPI0008C5AF8E|nr:glycosyltransferase domain-containing protein [Butyrivibrio sp. ob235]SEK63735.1 Protein of unknown function [Butyrivibrio sp. ob235]
MFNPLSDEEKSRISYLLKNLECENENYLRLLYNSQYYKTKVLSNYISTGQFLYLAKRFFRRDKKIEGAQLNVDYFSDERIAIYSCVTGKYDSIQKPIILPDNCDFYMVTDDPESVENCWNYIDVDEIVPDKSMSPKDKNRFVKMHPDYVFKDYKYSIYIDGNIKPISDFTKYINMVGQCGIATFMHPHNRCVYKECRTVLENKKASREEIDKHLQFFKKEGMPKNFGFADCGLIVRRHNDKMCRTFMDEWWEQYCQYSKRDQISFAYTAFKQGIQMSEITVLGKNMYKDYAIRRLPHFL